MPPALMGCAKEHLGASSLFKPSESVESELLQSSSADHTFSGFTPRQSSATTEEDRCWLSGDVAWCCCEPSNVPPPDFTPSLSPASFDTIRVYLFLLKYLCLHSGFVINSNGHLFSLLLVKNIDCEKLNINY